VVKLEEMRWTAIQVVFLALVLAMSNSACAMSCSAQPCHQVPPCHQHHGVTACQHVLPVADVACAVVSTPVLATVIAPELTVRRVPAASAWPSPALVNFSSWRILRI
jgi:hypothetical protein